MADSLSEVSSSMEALEGTEDGKKRSKFRAFKSFFGKKKKKESEDVPELRGIKPRFSSSSASMSSLKPVLEGQMTERKSKSSMGSKAISHDSVFCLDPESEKLASAGRSSPEPLRGRSRKMPPLRSRKFSTSPTVTRAERFSRNLEKDFADVKIPKSSKYKSSLQHSPTQRKSMCVSELSSDPELSQSSQSSSQQPSGFSTPATSHSCLDSSAAKHKIALNPRRQTKKTISTTVRVKPEEQRPSVTLKEKTIKIKMADQKEPKRDITGPSIQEKSNKTETQDKKMRDQVLSIDAGESIGYSISGTNPRRRRRRPKNEWGIIERSLLQSTQERNLSSKVEASPNEKMASREHSLWQVFLEKQGTGQLTTAEGEGPPQKMLSDKGGIKEKTAAIDVEVQGALAPQPTTTDAAEPMISGPALCREDESSGGKKKRERAVLLPWKRPFTTQEEANVLRAPEAQMHMHPSQGHGEEAETLSLGLQRFQPKTELSLEGKTFSKEKHPRSGLRGFSASVARATAEHKVSMKMSPLPLRRWPNTGEISSDSKSTSEYESSSEVQLVPAQFQPIWKPKDDAAVFHQSESIDAGLSKMEQQPLKQSSHLEKAREVSSDIEHCSGDQKSCEAMTSSQSLEEFEECSESRSFVIDSVSEEHLASSSHFQALRESEEKEVSTESSSYVEKYHSSEDLSSSEEDKPLLEHSKQTWGQFRDKQEAPVSKSAPVEWRASAKPVRPIHSSPPIVGPVMSSSEDIAVGQSRSVEPLPPSHAVKSWVSTPQSEHQVFADPEGVATDQNVFMQPVPSRKASKHLMGYNLEKNVPSSPDLPVLDLDVLEENIATQPLRYASQPSVKPNTKKERSLGTESAAFERSVSIEPPPPQHHSQPLLKPFVQQQVSAFERNIDSRLPTHHFQPWKKPQGKQSFSSAPESTAFEGNTSMKPLPLPLSQPVTQPYQNVPLESEAIAATVISVGSLHTKNYPQSLPKPQSQAVSESTSVEGATLVEPSVKPKFQTQMTGDSVSSSNQWSSPKEPISTQRVFHTQANPKFKQVSVGRDSPEAQGSISMQPVPPRCSSQSWMTPNFEQVPVTPSNVPAAWAVPIYTSASRMPSQPLTGSVVKQPVFAGSGQQITTVEPRPPRNTLPLWRISPFEQVSVPKDNVAAARRGISTDPPAPRMPSQPLTGSIVKQPVSTEFKSVSVPLSSSVELVPSRFPLQPRKDPESYAAKEGVSVMMRSPRKQSQLSVSSGFKEEVSPNSARASEDWSVPTEPMPSKNAPQPWLGHEFEQQTSSVEGNPPQTTIKQKLQKTPSSFESTSVEGDIPWKPVSPKHPTPLLVRSKVQEMSSRLESAAAQDSSKKSQNSRAPTQSFVKFMAEQIFSESAASEADIRGKPALRGRSRPSRSLLKPKLEEEVFLYDWADYSKEDTTLENLPMKHRSQSLRRSEELKEALPYSEGPTVKWSSSAGDISQSLGKAEYRQEVSVSVSFPEEWKRDEGQMPSTQPSQAFDKSGLQPPILSKGPADVPMEWNSPEGYWPPSQPTQAFISDYQQQVYLSSDNAAAEGTISENTGSWPMAEAAASSKKTKKYSQGYGYFIKSTPTSITKPGKFTSQKAFVPTGIYSKDVEEDPPGRDGNESPFILSTSKIDVENVFGVRLRRISQKSEVENPDPYTQFVPVSASANKEWANKEALQDFSGSLEKFSSTPSFAGKQGNRLRYEGMSKKPAVYRLPGKIYSWKTDTTTEPAWITVAKQRQKSFGSHFPTKPRNRGHTRAETKEPRYEAKYDPTLEIPPEEPEPINTRPSRMMLSPNIPRQMMGQSRMSKSTKSVAFDDQKMRHTYTKERETRRSSSLPPKFSAPEEPVWFSMAKQKAKAWSQMAEMMQ